MKLLLALLLLPILAFGADNNYTASTLVQYTTNGATVAIQYSLQRTFVSNIVDAASNVGTVEAAVDMSATVLPATLLINNLTTNSWSKLFVGSTQGVYFASLTPSNAFLVVPMNVTNLFIKANTNSVTYRATAVPGQ